MEPTPRSRRTARWDVYASPPWSCGPFSSAGLFIRFNQKTVNGRGLYLRGKKHDSRTWRGHDQEAGHHERDVTLAPGFPFGCRVASPDLPALRGPCPTSAILALASRLLLTVVLQEAAPPAALASVDPRTTCAGQSLDYHLCLQMGRLRHGGDRVRPLQTQERDGIWLFGS